MTAHDQPHLCGADGLPFDQWLHDHVVPSLMAAGLRVELARASCSPEATEHLDHAARILDDLARRVRDEMGRCSGRPISSSPQCFE